MLLNIPIAFLLLSIACTSSSLSANAGSTLSRQVSDIDRAPPEHASIPGLPVESTAPKFTEEAALKAHDKYRLGHIDDRIVLDLYHPLPSQKNSLGIDEVPKRTKLPKTNPDPNPNNLSKADLAKAKHQQKIDDGMRALEMESELGREFTMAYYKSRTFPKMSRSKKALIGLGVFTATIIAATFDWGSLSRDKQ